MKRIKNQIASIIYKLIFVLVKLLPKREGQKHLVLVKTDEIGDFVMFRNYFKYFRTSQKFNKYKITLVANAAWKKLYEEFDKDVFDDVIWLDKNKFKMDLLFRFSILKKIRNLGASYVINCIYSRCTIIDDGIVFILTGAKKVAMIADKNNRLPNEHNWDRLIYTEIIDAGDVTLFDVQRSVNFLNKVIEVGNLPLETKFKIASDDNPITGKYFIMFLGAGNPERRWPVQNFIEIAEYTNKKYGLIPVLCGGPGDDVDAEKIECLYKNRLINLAGKTSLVEMAKKMAFAEFVICVDTGAVHIAAATGVPVIGLYSGKFFQRFAPYPKQINEHFYPVYPDFVDEMIAKKDVRLFDTDIMKNDTIKQIAPTKVFPFVDLICSSKMSN